MRRRSVLAAAFATAILPRLARGQQETDATSSELTGMKIRLTFSGRTMTATLYDNPSARELGTMLPLDLTASDFSNNEKIAYLPRKLTKLVRGPFPNAAPGDLCYYIPWGNLALFHSSYESIPDLVRLGRLDGDLEPLRHKGETPLRIERAE